MGTDASGITPPSSYTAEEWAEVKQEMAGLEAEETARLEAKAAVEAEIRDLMAREAAGEGVFAARIHELRQKCHVLEWEAQHLRARINRLANPWY